MPSVTATKILARSFNFEVNTGTTLVPVWVPIRGINTFSVDNAKSDADTTDFDDNGRDAHLPASRSLSIKLDGFFMVDTTDGARDAGQAAIDVLGDAIGPAGLAPFRYYHEVSNKGKQFSASFVTTGPGGGKDDPAAWSVEITSSGAVTSITVTP